MMSHTPLDRRLISGSGLMTSPGSLPPCPPLLPIDSLFHCSSYGSPLAMHCGLSAALPTAPAVLYHALMMTSYYRRQFSTLCSMPCYSRSPSAVKRSAAEREVPSDGVSTRQNVPIDDDGTVPSDSNSSFKCRRLDEDSCSLHSADSASRKCAGTQTSFSSFLNSAQQTDCPSNPLDPYAGKTRREIPPEYDAGNPNFSPFDRLAAVDDTNNVPLNLTISCNQSNQSNARGHSHQSSPPRLWQPLDQCGGQRSTDGGWDGANGWRRTLDADSRNAGLKRPDSSPCLRPGEQLRKTVSVVTVECDQDIEAHFQRSLGRDYSRHFVNNSSPLTLGNTDKIPQENHIGHHHRHHHQHPVQNGGGSLQVAVADSTREESNKCGRAELTNEGRKLTTSVSVSVDDHFSKSLGPMWNHIKTTLDVSTPQSTDPAPTNISDITPAGASTPTRKFSPVPGSVDDHFAKALGETWFKIQAEREKV